MSSRSRLRPLARPEAGPDRQPTFPRRAGSRAPAGRHSPQRPAARAHGAERQQHQHRPAGYRYQQRQRKGQAGGQRVGQPRRGERGRQRPQHKAGGPHQAGRLIFQQQRHRGTSLPPPCYATGFRGSAPGLIEAPSK